MYGSLNETNEKLHTLCFLRSSTTLMVVEKRNTFQQLLATVLLCFLNISFLYSAPSVLFLIFRRVPVAIFVSLVHLLLVIQTLKIVISLIRNATESLFTKTQSCATDRFLPSNIVQQYNSVPVHTCIWLSSFSKLFQLTLLQSCNYWFPSFKKYSQHPLRLTEGAVVVRPLYNGTVVQDIILYTDISLSFGLLRASVC